MIERKLAKLQWLQDPNEINGDNLNNIRRETNRHFRKKYGISQKTKLMRLQRTVRTRILDTCTEE
jgi:hypothetical protein